MRWLIPPSVSQRLMGILPLLLGFAALYAFVIAPWAEQSESSRSLAELRATRAPSVSRSLVAYQALQQETEQLESELQARLSRFQGEAWTLDALRQDLLQREQAGDLTLQDFQELNQQEQNNATCVCRISTTYANLCHLLTHWQEQTWPPTLKSLKVYRDSLDQLNVELTVSLFTPPELRTASR